MRKSADLIVDAGWALPIAPENRVVENSSVAVAAGAIVAFGSSDAIHREYEASTRLTRPNAVLMPGLVNAHGHAAMTLLRGVADDPPLDVWLNEHIWPLETRHMGEELVTDGTDLAIAEMLKSGTTCFSDMYFHPEVSAARAQRARIRAQVCFPIISFANAWSASPADAFRKGLALIDAYRNDSLVHIGFGPHSVYTVRREDLTKIATLAEEVDAPVQIHLHETATEVREGKASYGMSPLVLLDQLAFLSPRVQVVHLTNATDDELDRLARSGAGVVHCPQSNLKLGSGLCSIARLVARGIPWALGTDGAASNNGLDLLQEARVAILLARMLAIQTDDRPVVPDTLATLRAATLGGAHVLGLGAEIGSLEPGKRADLILIDLDDIAQLPVHRPESQLVFTAAGSRVSHVWVDGRPVVADGQLLTLDEADVKMRARAWITRMRATPA
jgi:5-methylthioadenosine/S-adenosylhomocysteine deaminase